MKYKHLIFDFDGVLVESNEIRFEGFQLLFRDYPVPQIEKLVQFARLNGGLSRYEKIRYFFEAILNKHISEDAIQILTKQYSKLVKQKIIEANFVNGALDFLFRYYNDCNFAIVSGSDQEELREVCQVRKISHFFVEVLGSPASKESNLALLMTKTGWGRGDSLFIGDSINDLNAALTCGIDFIGRNSGLVDWSRINNSVVFIDDISQLYLHLE